MPRLRLPPPFGLIILNDVTLSKCYHNYSLPHFLLHHMLSKMFSTSFSTPPPRTSFTKISFPAEHVLLVTLSRPKSLNCINTAGHDELHAIWEWLDNEPLLRVGIVTGEGRAFCAGADLKGNQHTPDCSMLWVWLSSSYRMELCPWL